MLRFALIPVLAICLGLGACGRRGALEPPPEERATPQAQPGIVPGAPGDVAQRRPQPDPLAETPAEPAPVSVADQAPSVELDANGRPVIGEQRLEGADQGSRSAAASGARIPPPDRSFFLDGLLD
jgi:predicted small lipoprotein YifL